MEDVADSKHAAAGLRLAAVLVASFLRLHVFADVSCVLPKLSTEVDIDHLSEQLPPKRMDCDCLFLLPAGTGS